MDAWESSGGHGDDVGGGGRTALRVFKYAGWLPPSHREAVYLLLSLITS